MKIERKIKKAMSKTAWDAVFSMLRMLINVSPYFHVPVIGSRLKKVYDLEPEAHTQGYTLNLNKDLTDKSQNVVLPIDMMKQAVRQSDYRAIMKKCLCRSAFDCKTYPHDHACLFLGEGARKIVKAGMGREATIEEALAHVDKGAELGLVGQALWIEVERVLFGIKRDKNVAHWLEMCFCCPCCCGTFKLNKATTSMDVKGRFHSIGWKAIVDDEVCIQCEKCVKKCPIEVISVVDGRIVINQQACLGCGICAAHCPKEAIKLKLQTPLLENVQDYFTSNGLKVEI